MENFLVRKPHLLLSFLLCLSSSFLPSSYSLNADGLSLLALKSAITSDPTRILSRWSESDATPCHWAGVSCSDPDSGHVTSLSLPGRMLTGYIPYELGALLSLRHLTLSHNNFSSFIPSRLFNASSLASLDLSHNSLSGPIPAQISSLRSLTSLDLSSNILNGSLPGELSELTRLGGTLNLSYNRFSGEIPASFGRFRVMVSLDLRHNNLSGKIPQVGSLFNQGPTAFAGNPRLCGFPLNNPCPEAQDPNLPLNPDEIPVTSNPNLPENKDGDGREKGEEKSKLKPISVPLISGAFVVVGAVFLSVLIARRKRRLSAEAKMANKKKEVGEKDQVEVAVSTGESEEQKGRFVVMDEGFQLDLEDLLRASAYVVGKTGSGIVYKVVVGGGSSGGRFGVGGTTAAGSVVAVRRLSEGDDATWWVREFESKVEAIGRVHCPNFVRMRAHYYASDEKLLVSDFIRNGGRHSALHGNPLLL